MFCSLCWLLQTSKNLVSCSWQHQGLVSESRVLGALAPHLQGRRRRSARTRRVNLVYPGGRNDIVHPAPAVVAELCMDFFQFAQNAQERCATPILQKKFVVRITPLCENGVVTSDSA